jgi:hypothetical protein
MIIVIFMVIVSAVAVIVAPTDLRKSNNKHST